MPLMVEVSPAVPLRAEVLHALRLSGQVLLRIEISPDVPLRAKAKAILGSGFSGDTSQSKCLELCICPSSQPPPSRDRIGLDPPKYYWIAGVPPIEGGPVEGPSSGCKETEIETSYWHEHPMPGLL